MILGVDLSHHKSGGNLSSLKEQGYSFVLLKATEGASFVDTSFNVYLKAARQYELPVAAYHYVRVSDTWESQVTLITQVVPRNVPVILDIERGSGADPQMWRDMVAALRKHGYVVPFVYVPRWYWVQIGEPSLKDLPPLWGSHYVNGSGYGSELFRQVVPSYWSGYGDNFVGMLQFTSSAKVGGLPANIDVSAFVGSTNDLMDLFNLETPVSGSDVWDAILTSRLDYSAPAHEWMTMMSERVELMQTALTTLQTDLATFMGEVRGKLDGLSGLTVEQQTEAFRAALPNLKVTGEFTGSAQ